MDIGTPNIVWNGDWTYGRRVRFSVTISGTQDKRVEVVLGRIAATVESPWTSSTKVVACGMKGVFIEDEGALVW